MIIEAILLLFYFPRKSFPSKTNRLFRALLVNSALSTGTDILSVVLMRKALMFPLWLHYIVNISYFLTQNAQTCIFMLYILSFTGESVSKDYHVTSRIVVIPYLTEAVIMLSTPFTKLAFFFDENMGYHQGVALPGFYVISFLYIISCTAMMIKGGKTIQKRKKTAAYLFMTVTMVGMAVQFVLKTILVNNFSAACSCLIIFMILQNPEETEDRETGMFTREAFISVITEHIRQGDSLMIYLILPDNLKSVGKVLGFNALSMVIRMVGEHFGREFRTTPYLIDGNCVAIIRGDTSAEDRSRSIEKIKSRFTQPWKAGEIDIVRTCSIGCVEMELGASTEQVLDRINDTMDEMKHRQCDCVVLPADIPNRRARLDELEKQKLLLEEESREANAAKERAENADRQKSIFLANMSHEIRTPMNAIIGMTDLILRDDINERVRANANDIKSAGDSLLAIVNDVLDISKVESGKMEIASEEYDFKKLISDIVSLVSTRIDKTKVDLRVDLDLNLPCRMVGDEVRVKQIMVNLLNNAAKFTEKGHILLRVKGEREGIRCKLHVDVEDTGRGIRQEDLNKLFKSFSRIETNGNRYIEGTGLGLALCKKLVEAMGGDITVTSEYGKGSTFSFDLYQTIATKTTIRDDCLEGPGRSVLIITENETDQHKLRVADTLKQIGIPVASCCDGSEVETAMKNGNITHVFSYRSIYERYADWLKGYSNPSIVLFAEPNLRYDDIPEIGLIYDPIYPLSVDRVIHAESRANKTVPVNRLSAPTAKVLVVDDNIINIKVVEGLLKCYDIEADSCDSGAEAIEKVSAKEYDIVFMDHMMPHMDGVEAMHRIRALGTRTLDMPIIALTANAVTGVRNMFITEGFNDYISKPVNIGRLEAVLRRFLPADMIMTSSDPEDKSPKKPDEVKKSDAVQTPSGEILSEINREKGLANCSGNEDRYAELLDTFYKCADVQRKQIKKLYSNGNNRTLKVEAHALKSIANSVGAVNLAEDAASLENALKSAEQAEISRAYARLMSCFDLLVEQLEMYYNNKNKESVKKGLGGLSDDVIRQKLDLIFEALDNFDDDSAKTYIDNLAGYDIEPKLVGMLVNMRNSTELFDYTSARAIGEDIIRLLDEKNG